MAAQTDAPDDLIAELARLMADDARPDQGTRAETPRVEPVAQPTPAPAPAPAVRIPGGDAPTVAPVPRFDFSTSNGAAAAPKPAATPTPSIRIPGSDPVPPRPLEAAPEPFNFDFSAELAKKPAGPASPVSAAPSVAAAAPQPVAPQPVVAPTVSAPPKAAEPAPELDHDSLADLIAAELANDMGGNDQPLPEPPVAKREEDNFGVPPVFGLGSPTSEAKIVDVPQPDFKPEPLEVVVRDIPPVTSVEPPARTEPVFVEEPRVERTVEPRFEPVPEPQPDPVALVSEPEPEAEPEPAPYAAAPQRDPNDPLSEIERLVGPAVNMGREEPKGPSPALRSLATPTLPPQQPEVKPASLNEPKSVDEAILAAAAATGARVEWVDPNEDPQLDEDDAPVAMGRPRRQVRLSRAVAGPLVALGLLAVAGGGLYWVLGQGGAPSGPAPLIVADTSVTKEVPPPVESQAQQSVVFNEISGANDPADEQIVSRDQADEAAVSEASAAANAAASSPIANSGVIGGADGTSVDPNQAGLVNRKVRTVTVRPDGTIVSGDDSMAGASILPVDRPDVPDVPGADFSTPELIANAEANVSTPTTPAAEVSTTPSLPLVQPGSLAQVVDGAGAVLTGKTVAIPNQKPSDFAQAATSALASAALPPSTPAQATPAVQQQPAAAAAPAPSGGTAAAYVQLSSQRSEQAARESAQAIINRFGPVFGGANIEIVRADLGERGIYYRVLVPANSRQEASNMCSNIKAAGGDCVLL